MDDIKKKKIIHIVYSGLGGHANVLFNLISADKDNEYTYEVLFYGVEPIRKEYVNKCNDIGIYYSYVRKKAGIDFLYFYKIFKQIKESKSDILFLHGAYNIIPAFFNKITGNEKCIIVRETQANHLKSKQDWAFTILGILLSNTVVFLSEKYKNQIIKRYKILKIIEKFPVIPNGIEIEKFYVNRDFKKDYYHSGMLSRIVPIKDHKTLIFAIEKLVKDGVINFKLTIAGDGSSLKELKKQVKDLNLTNYISFLGLIDQTEILKFFNELDIYIHATEGETMSTSIMQAQASGLPIIATDVDGVNNVITEYENGLLAEFNNPESYKEKIIELTNNPSMLKKYSEASLKYAQDNLSNLKMFHLYKQIFN